MSRRRRQLSTIGRIGSQLFVVAAIIPAAVSGQARAPLIQSLEVRIPVAPTPVVITGKRHLVYEVHLTNLRALDVALTRVEIADARSNARLASYDSVLLGEKLGRPGANSAAPNKRIIGSGMRAVLYVWLALDDALRTPAWLRHRIEFEALRTTNREHGVVDGAETAVREQPAVVLDAPLRGGPWVALYDPAMDGGHRRAIYTIAGTARIPARFATDWVRLETDGSRTRGDPSLVASWHGYGAEVLAVADAVVAEARDDMPGAESITASQGSIPLENASGNFVTLDLGQRRYAFYEHLKPGSVRVQPGERVKRGQVIAELGNTGSSSSGPHLHFHVSDANSPLGAEGLPYVFRQFEVIGAFDAIEAFARGERWKSAASPTAGVRVRELPDANVVVVFPSKD